jgi:hypothetical protein
MRVARKLVLVAVMAGTAVAMSASVASAHVSVRAEPSADCAPCLVTADSVVNAGGFTGTAIIAMVNGIEINTGVCEDEFDASISENGLGTISNQELHGGATCAKKPCGATTAESGNGTAWPVEIRETAQGSGQFRAEVRFCVRPDSSGVDTICHLNEILVTEANHMMVFDVPHTPCENTGPPNPTLEVLGRWEVNGSGLELNHGAP